MGAAQKSVCLTNTPGDSDTGSVWTTLRPIMQCGNVHELNTGGLSEPGEPSSLPKVTRTESDKARMQTQCQKKLCILCTNFLGRTHHAGHLYSSKLGRLSS